MAISTDAFLAILKKHGYRYFSGVPCSNFADLFQRVGEDRDFTDIKAANEGSALALAAGSTLAGHRSVVALQNSGLGNAINPLTSLLLINRIPVLLLISVRGHPDETPDEPQHREMGLSSHNLLEQFSIGFSSFSEDETELYHALAKAEQARRKGMPYAILFRKGQLSPVRSSSPEYDPVPYSMSIEEAVGVLKEHTGQDDLVLSTTGYISRILFATEDRPENFYMQGAMGHCSAVAAGLALSEPSRRVIVLDGDGAVLMHMGALSTIGHLKPGNFVHIVLDNERYESTGGQPTTSLSTAIERVAAACGYQTNHRSVTAEDFHTALKACAGKDGPHLILCKVNRKLPAVLPRVTSRYSPEENRSIFQASLVADSKSRFAAGSS